MDIQLIMAQQEVMVRRRNRQTQGWRRAVERGARHVNTFLFAGCRVLILGKQEHYVGTKADIDT